MTTRQARGSPLGYAVATADGKHVGWVRQVEGGAFRVETLQEPACWLPLRSVFACWPQRLTLAWDREQLGAFIVEQLPLSAAP